MSFLYGNQLTASLENLIKNSKNKLVLISPYISLDGKTKDVLMSKVTKTDFELKVLFGKAKDDKYFSSLKKESFEFFKQFPKIEIRYNERLHAKYYQNDYSFIITSLNLYEYSLANNIEVGVKFEHSSKGLVDNVLDVPNALINTGVDIVKQSVFGQDADEDPIIKFEEIFNNSKLLYKTEPVFEDKRGLTSVFSQKKIIDKKIIVNAFEENFIKQRPIQTEVKEMLNISKEITTKTLSVTQLSKKLNIEAKAITSKMETLGYIKGNTVTSKGIEKGITLKNYMGNDYIAYPENLNELKDI